MAVLHDFECMAHGVFEKRVEAGKIPKCPRGCSPAFVTLVHLQAPGTVSGRTRTGDRLVREMAEMQGLSDISTSPSRPGGNVAQRNAMRLKGPAGRQYPELAAAKAVDIGKYLGAMTMKDNALTRIGLGHEYNANEWKRDAQNPEKLRHVGAQGPILEKPTGSTGVSIERVKE
jgi:hypothetical protein